MLFTTAIFAFVFLPLVLAGYFALGRRWPGAAALWLLAASVFFYGWWMPQYTALLLASIAINFVLGGRIARQRPQRGWLVAGIVFNLGLLGYYKYANFFVGNLEAMLGTQWQLARIVLPIGISFFTFTQIAYLVDTWAGKVREQRPVHYGLFVTYFPHLIAGPVLHHAQMMPQFADRAVYRFDGRNFAAGALIFAIGLAKKVLLADGVAPYADAVFGPADAGLHPAAQEAWLAAVAYTLQLYFDFSGYSDMAIGLSWMFNIRLPFNFDSPYRARNISEFWRRWHISLSNFLRDYLYIALGGNRKGPVRRYLNLGATMLLGGLWHGAAWSFVLWGALHGAYLMLHHGWRAVRGGAGTSRLGSWLAWGLTLLAVVVAWVPFRAETLAGAGRILHAMTGTAQGLSQLPGTEVLLWNAGLHPHTGLLWCAVLGVLALALPNSNAIGTRARELLGERAALRPLVGAAMLAAAALLVLVNESRGTASAFIYFNF